MTLGITTPEYTTQRKLYDDYLKKSRISRTLRKMSFILLTITTIVVISVDVFTNIEPIEPLDLMRPEYSLSYIFTAGTLFIIIITPILALSSRYFRDKIREEYSYPDIKRDYIFMYESMLAYKNYLDNHTPVRKKDAIKCLENSYKVIDTMSYGNIPVTLNPNIEQIDFIKKDLKPIIINMMESKDPAEQYNARELLKLLIQFLYNKNTTLLNVVYESAMKYKVEEVYVHHITSRKDITIAYIANHPGRSQIIFTFISLVFVIIFGKIIGASNPVLLAPCVAAIGSSFPIFTWIKNVALKIEP